MSEFHRMITYLYLYEQGTKSRNTGFAKVEKREQRCLLEIHMKNTGCSLSPVPVYFYVQKESQLAGIPLGNFSLTRGSGDFKTILDAKNIKDSGYGLDIVKGIYIPLTGEMMLVSQWDDDEFRPELFAEITETETNISHSEKEPQVLQAAENHAPTHEKTDNAPAKEPMNSAPAKKPTGSAPPQKPTGFSPAQTTTTSAPVPDISETMPDAAETPTKPASQQQQTTPAPDVGPQVSNQSQKESSSQHIEDDISHQDTEDSTEKPADALKAVEALPRSFDRTAGFHTVTGKETHTSKQNPKTPKLPGTEQPPQSSQADAPEDWDLRWRFILENYPVMTPFAGDENTLCVRMELKDLRQLPKQFWYLGNNSFLLHGFFNYRYFILGMTEEFGVKKWFIGVPGVFQNPERVMAALFGFPEFRSEKQSAINTGEFGYWYRYLNELSEPAGNSHS